MNFLVNKESTVAPVCSSNYSSRRLYEGQELKRNSSKSQKTSTYNSKKESLINQKSNVQIGSSVMNNHLDVNFHQQEVENKVLSKELDEICIVGSGKTKNNFPNIFSDNKLKNSNEYSKNFTKESKSHCNNNINRSNNPFKRLKVNESPENIRTEPIDYLNNSFNSNKSGMENKMQNTNESKDFKNNVNMDMKKNYNKTNQDLNENSIKVSLTNVNNKNKSTSSIIDNSALKKSQIGTIFNYNDFFNKMKKKSENRREVSSNISQKTSFLDNSYMKRSLDKILDKINNHVERSKIIKFQLLTFYYWKLLIY